MSARAVGWIIAVLLVLVAAGTSWLFWVQNSARKVMLSLNLVVTKIQLVEPIPAPVLVAVCFGTGVLLGMVLVAILWSRASARARRTRAPVGYTSTSDDGWRSESS